MNLEKEIYDFAHCVHMNEHATEKEKAIAAELLASLHDYYEEIQNAAMDGRITTDYTVTVKVDGQQIKFQNIEKVAEWMTNEQI